MSGNKSTGARAPLPLDYQRPRRGGLHREPCFWGICWTGSAEQLIGAGVVTDEVLKQAAEQPMRRGVSRAPLLLPTGRMGRIYRWGRHRWNVGELFSEEEQEQQRQAKQKWLTAQRFASPKQVREQVRLEVQNGACIILRAFNLTNDAELPYRFDDDTRAELLHLIARLKGLSEYGGLTLQKPAGDDARFERFMRDVLP